MFSTNTYSTLTTTQFPTYQRNNSVLCNELETKEPLYQQMSWPEATATIAENHQHSDILLLTASQPMSQTPYIGEMFGHNVLVYQPSRNYFAQSSNAMLPDAAEHRPYMLQEHNREIATILKRRPPLNKGDWARMRTFITQLYKYDQKPLKEVVAILKEKYGFDANEQMVKKRITKWGLERNLNQNVVDQILGIYADRQKLGKDTTFIFRGEEVTLNTVYGYMRKKKSSISAAVARYKSGKALACPDLRALSPKMSSKSLLGVVHSDSYERCLYEYRLLNEGLLESGFYSEEDDGLYYQKNSIADEIFDFITENTIPDLADAVRQNKMVQIRRFGLLIERGLEIHHLEVSKSILDRVLQMIIDDTLARFGRLLLDHFCAMIAVKVRTGMPTAAFLYELVKIDAESLINVSIAFSEIDLDLARRLRSSEVRFWMDTAVNLVQRRFLYERRDEAVMYERLLIQSLDRLDPLNDDVLYLLILGLKEPELRSSAVVVLERVMESLKSDPVTVCQLKKCLKVGSRKLSEQEANALQWLCEYVGDLERAKSICAIVLDCQSYYALSLDCQFWYARKLDWYCTQSEIADGDLQWRQRMREIVDIWEAEIEAATPDDDLSRIVAT